MLRGGRPVRAVGAIALVAATLCLPASAGATTWTQIPSGASTAITAIEYQSPTRFWFTTANGEIFTRSPGGEFTRHFGPTGIPLNDIEFLPPPSEVGLAVGNAGQVLRTVNGGTTWTSVTGIPVSKSGTTFPDCTGTSPLGDVYSVRFASETSAWIMAEATQLARSNGTSSTVGATATWVDANWEDKGTAGRSAEDKCKIAASYSEGIGDAFFVPGNPNVAYFCEGSFHEVFFTANGLSSPASKKSASCGNGQGPAHLAGDPANPSRMWAVTQGPYGISMTARTSDGWGSGNPFTAVNIEAREFSEAADVDFAGGTVLSAGAAGMILSSADGSNFYFNDAAGSLATTTWSAVSLAGANDGAVGGEGGILAITADASALVPQSSSGGGGGTVGRDTTRPQTTITKKPKKSSAKRKAKFKFTSSEPGSTFECRFDKAKKFTACKSPLTKKVKPGKHKFEVRAIDRAGNADATPATWKFKVTAPKHRH
jgi:hypothetical protein